MYSRASKRLALLALAFGVVGLLVVPSVAFAHAHFKGGTPFRVPLVIAYSPCTSPNPAGEGRTGPLSGCATANNPPDGLGCGTPGGQVSCNLTVNSPDNSESPGPTQGQAGLRIDVCPTGSTGAGTVSLPPQLACTAPDDRIGVKITDVRCGPTGSPCGAAGDNAPGTALDYLGSIGLRFVIRITDHDNTTSANNPLGSATSADLPLAAPQLQGGQCLGAPSANCTDAGGNPTAMPCLDTPGEGGVVAATGSTCTIQTTVNSYFAGFNKGGKVANLEIGQVQVLDSAGKVFMVQGIFNP